MTEKEIKHAKQFHVLEEMQNLERDLLAINGMEKVEYDLTGLFDDIYQVILLPFWNFPYDVTEDYFIKKVEFIRNIIQVCRNHGLYSSGDTIEDMGSCYYIVRSCGKEWRDKIQSNKSTRRE